MPLEREVPLASLVAAVDDAVAGRGGIVLISGEAGIGKTTLVRAFTGELSSGPRVLIGSCDDLLAPRTLGALRDAVRRGMSFTDAAAAVERMGLAI